MLAEQEYKSLLCQLSDGSQPMLTTMHEGARDQEFVSRCGDRYAMLGGGGGPCPPPPPKVSKVLTSLLLCHEE